jgi:hypothetical protein
MLLAHDTEEDAQKSAKELRGLGMRARRLLEECVADTGITTTVVSRAAQQLDNCGFVKIRDTEDMWNREFTITPTLLGEEALEFLGWVDG